MKRLWLILLVLCLLLSACGKVQPSQPSLTSNQTTEETATPSADAPTGISPMDENAAIQAKVAELIAQMTVDEKIGQMTQVEKNSIAEGDITRYFIGSIISGGGGSPANNSAAGWQMMVDGFQHEALATRLAIPLIYGLDAVHGHGNLYGATIFPHQIGLGATRDPELVRQIGQVTAEEVLATGIHWNFAPVLAVTQDIRWGRTYESYSEDPVLVTELGLAYLQGLQTFPEGAKPPAGGSLYTLGTPKHFLGDGGTLFGTSTQNIIQPYLLDQGDMQVDEATIRQLFLPPYQAAVESGAQSIMISFSSWQGVKMHAQKYWITDVLKGELGFQGFVVSDWGAIDQIYPENYYKSVVSAINAGVDMSMVPYDCVRFINAMKRGVMKGDISLDRINDAVSRILTVKYKLGLFDQPYGDPSLQSVVGSAEHRALARQAVRQSLVLLKNEGEALPLAKDLASIYVAGVAANDIGLQCGGWTIEWQGKAGAITPGTTILQGLKETVSANTQVEFSVTGQFNGMAEVGIAVVGEMPYAEGVGDRADLRLSDFDQKLVQQLRAHSQKIILVIISGRPLVITPEFKLADAVVAAWLPGTEGAGVTDGLFGDSPFTGKLPFTWPRNNAQLPINLNNSASASGCAAPLLPLGFGLGVAGSQSPQWLDCP